MKYGTKQTLTNPSALGASASLNIGTISRMEGAVGLAVRLWLNQDGAGDRVMNGCYVYGVGPDGATSIPRPWSAAAFSASGAAATYGNALNKAAVLDVAPPNAWVAIIPLVTGGLLPCLHSKLNLYVATTTGGAADYDSGKIVFECVPVYPDGHPDAATAALPF